jgi:DNA-binding MarR family transcriptional regulator
MRHADSETLTDLLLSLARHLHHEIKSRSDDALNPTQVQALFFIRFRPKPLMSEIASYLSIRPPSATTLVAELQKMKLVERETDPTDKRSIRISLTQKGRSLIQQRLHLVTERITELTKPLSSTEREQFIQLLDRILSPINQPSV